MDSNSLVLRGQIILETGDGEKILALKLNGVAEEFLEPDTIGDAEVWAERFIETRFLAALRCTIRAHIQRVRSQITNGRVDRPHTDWHPPSSEVQAYALELAAKYHDAFE